MDLLGGQARRGLPVRRAGRPAERARGPRVLPRRGHRDQLPLRVPERGEAAAEDAAGVDVDGAVQPLGLGDGRVAVDDHRVPPIFGGPVVADGKAELVRLAGGLAEERELPHPRRTPALQLRLHARMGHHQFASVEDVVAHQAFQELPQPRLQGGPPLLGHRLDFPERQREPLGDLNVAAGQRLRQLDVVVPGHAQGASRPDHVPHQA